MTAWHGMAILCTFPDGCRSQSTELKVEMVALHEKRVRKCLSKVKGEQTKAHPSSQITMVAWSIHPCVDLFSLTVEV